MWFSAWILEKIRKSTSNVWPYLLTQQVSLRARSLLNDQNHPPHKAYFLTTRINYCPIVPLSVTPKLLLDHPDHPPSLSCDFAPLSVTPKLLRRLLHAHHHYHHYHPHPVCVTVLRHWGFPGHWQIALCSGMCTCTASMCVCVCMGVCMSAHILHRPRLVLPNPTFLISAAISALAS